MNYEGFKTQVLAITGIDLSAYKENQMKRRIDTLIKKKNCQGYEAFITYLRMDRKNIEEFMEYLTINVTEFFRNPSQWNVLEKEIFPELLERRNTLRIWSAACSTGDEPYSLAMILSHLMPLTRVHILATDIDKEVLSYAKQGIYPAKSLMGVPKHLKDKYVIETKEGFKIKDELKRCILFKQHNLLKDPYPSGIDLIVCRNVLIYFTDEVKKKIYKKFNHALIDQGVLFVGSTEQIVMCQDFGFTSNKIFFYKKIKNA